MSKHRVQYLLNQDSAAAGSSSGAWREQPCGQCNKVFTRTGDLTKHQRNVHRGEKRHACTHCNKRFSEKGNLNKHFRRFHVDVKEYQCKAQGCTKQFSTSDALLRHRRQVHNL